MSEKVHAAGLEAEIRAKAKRRVRAKLGLMWHFAAFALANVAMFELNENYTPTVRWFVWPLAAWSVAFMFHAFGVLSAGGLSEDMIRAEIEKEKSRRGLA